MLSLPVHLYPLPVHSQLSYNIDFALSADATYFSTQIVNEIQSYKFKCQTLLLLWEVLSSSHDATPQPCCSSSFSVKGVIITIQFPEPETWASPSSPPLFKPTTIQQAPSSTHSAPTVSVQVKSWDYLLLEFCEQNPNCSMWSLYKCIFDHVTLLLRTIHCGAFYIGMGILRQIYGIK